MSLLKEAIENKKYDVRMIDKNLNRGVVEFSEVEQVLGDLDDVSENADWVNLVELAEDDGSQKQVSESNIEDSDSVSSNGSSADTFDDETPSF